MARINLGDKVIDAVTGLTGIAIGRMEWLQGCWRIMIQPPVDKEGKVPDSYTCDEPQVKCVTAAVSPRQDEENPGGPLPFTPTQR